MTKTMPGRSTRKRQPRASAKAAREPRGGPSRFLPGRWLRSPLLAAVVIVAAGVWAYSSSFRGVLVFDDIASITSNVNIKNLWPPWQAMQAPKDVTVAGRPVASLTLALNYAATPADARDALTSPGPDATPEDTDRFLRNIWGYHALNLAVHLLAALTLFGVARRSLLTDRLRARFGQSSTLLAFLVAIVWLLHPINTESVTYVVQRVESLMGLFYLLTLYCAIRAAEAGARRGWWMGASVAACALGMGSKEVMVTSPLVVVLWDWMIGSRKSDVRGPKSKVGHPVSDARDEDLRARSGERRARRTLYAGVAATWVIVALLAAGNPRSGSVGFGLGGWTWWSYLETQAGVVVHYLRLAIVPYPLVFDYEWSHASSLAEVAPQALLLCALATLTVIACVRRHPAGFLGAWFFLILAPTSSLLPIPTEVAAEHRMYLPVAAIVALAILAVQMVAERLGGGPRPEGPRLKQDGPKLKPGAYITAVAGIAIAVTFATMTYTRNADYWSDEGLMRDTVQKRPLNIRARVAYGADLLAARRFPEAEAELQVAARLEGSDKAHAQANMYLGSTLCAQGKLDEGIAHLEQALSLDPSLGEAHALLGEAYAGRGEMRHAIEHFKLALQAVPDNAAVLRRTAWLLATSPDPAIRDGRVAAQLAERAVRLTGRRDVMALEALMAAYAEQDRFADAVAAGREALAAAQAQGNALFVGGLEREIAVCAQGQKLRDAGR